MSIWSGATVLITGGSGSFGTAFLELLLATEHPAAVRALARSEHRLAALQRRLDDGRLRICKGDVRDYDRLLEVMDGANIVIHAAALKRVEGEADASEMERTNVEGSRNVARAAVERRVERVMGISSDKACQAITLYGATKLVTERHFLSPHGNSRTSFGICRYGNVVGSAGSIVPLFREQARTGRITITDRRCSRFWLSLDRAVAWVKRRVEMLEPSTLYVPVLPSVRVVDVAEAIAPHARIEVIGMRGIEKLHEQMVALDESRCARFVQDPETIDHFAIGSRPTGQAEFEYSSDRNEQWLGVDEIRDSLPDETAVAA